MYVSIICKKTILGAPVNFFFLYDSNKPDSVVFGTARFGEIKYHTLTMTPFYEFSCYGSLSCVSTLGKNVISAAPVKSFFL